jgi:D-alanyl-D-alanine carboxypeptidase (penicillin-binding protein 5/6)
MHRFRRFVIALAALATAATLGLGTAAADDYIQPPTVSASHAFVGDPLFGLDTQASIKYAISPDQQTAMASTTKVWTLDLVAHGLDQGWLNLNDQITINKYESNVGGSSMKDINGVPLEKGEVVKLKDLIAGMMYPSGNNATYAIARYWAQKYIGPNADWHDFVALMNTHAHGLGQTHTHFTNPNGFDNAKHYTTARELAEEFQHVLQDPFSAQLLGFNGTYTATTQGPNGPKTYKFTNGNGYVGWEGEKNGISPNCNGAQVGCIVRAATRIGRRLIVATMQGKRGAEENAMLDYGYAGIFQAHLQGDSGPVDAATSESVDCFGTHDAVTANLPPSGPVSLKLWNANLDTWNGITKQQEATVPGTGLDPNGGQTGDVDVAHLASGDIALLTQKGTGVTLSRWTVDRYGTLKSLSNGITAGTADTMALQPVYGDMFITAFTTPFGHNLVIKSWKAMGAGFVNLDTYIDYGDDFTQVSAAGPQYADIFTGHRAVTASIGFAGRLVLDTWGVDPLTGKITNIAELKAGTGLANAAIANFTATPFPTDMQAAQYYAVGFSRPGIGLSINLYKLDVTGMPLYAGTTYSAGAFAGDRIKLAPLGTGGLMAAVTESSALQHLEAWDLHRNANDTIAPTQVATRDLLDGSVDFCRLPLSTHADGDYVTATRSVDGLLHVQAWRSGDRPY